MGEALFVLPLLKADAKSLILALWCRAIQLRMKHRLLYLSTYWVMVAQQVFLQATAPKRFKHLLTQQQNLPTWVSPVIYFRLKHEPVVYCAEQATPKPPLTWRGWQDLNPPD